MEYGHGRRPNFFVVGTFKGGTTSIHRYLSQHPDIFMPELKEPRYFAYDADDAEHRSADELRYPVRSEDAYLELFKEVSGHRAIGEASPVYLDSAIAAARIANFNPDAKVIISLRDPISRAHSGYQMWIRSGRETRGVTEAMRPGERWVEGSMYAEKLRRYYLHFPKNQIKILLFENLVSNTGKVIADLFEFLDVAPNYAANTSKAFNPGGLPRSRAIQYVMHRAKYLARQNPIIKNHAPTWLRNMYYGLRNKNLDRVSLPPEIDQMLAQYYVDDADEVARITGVATDVWRLRERAKGRRHP
jgi:Sulfotransferase family